MEREIHEHKLLEYGELGGYIYGTHLDTIRDVFKQVIITYFKLCNGKSFKI